MKNCTYRINRGKSEPLTYEQLIEEFYKLEQSDRDTIIDCLFKVSNPKQEQIKSKLIELQKKYIADLRGDNTEYGSAEISFQEVNNRTVWSTQTFIDSDYFRTIRGDKIILSLNRDDFRKHIIKQNIDRLGEVGAKNLADRTIEHWDIIAKDSPILHEILNKGWATKESLEKRLKGTAFEDISSMLFELIEGTENIYNKKNGVFSGFIPGTTRLIQNLNMKCKLLGIDQDIIGHIDNLIIDDSGDLHIVNYKISTTSITDVKEEKYKYQLALLKQMLANAGFNTERMTLSIIPIRLQYNDDFTKVEDVVAMPKIEYTIDKGRYVFTRYDSVVKNFIESTAVIDTISSEKMKNADRALSILFPDKNISTRGIQLTAEEWIKDHYRVDIKPSNKEGVYWTVFFGKDDIVEIKDPESPLKNEQIKKEVKKRIRNLQIGNNYIGAAAILKKVKTWYHKGDLDSFSNEREFQRCGKYFDKVFFPYMQRVKIDDKYRYDWIPIENDLLQNENILMFRNRITHQIDVITISPYNLDVIAKMRGKYTNILGQYIGDNTAISENIMKSNYGNIEAIRTMFIINEVLSGIEGNYSLGTLQIVSPESMGTSKIYPFQLITNQFTKILNTLKKENESDIKIINNFKGVKFQDSVEAFMLLKDNALQENLLSSTEKVNLRDWGIEMLENSNSRETKLVILKNIMRSMEDPDSGWGVPSDLNQLNNWALLNEENRVKAQLYKSVVSAVMQYSGLDSKLDLNESDMSSMQSYMQSSANISSINARVVTQLFAQAVNRIAEKSDKDARPVQRYLTEFYKEAGFSNLQNSTLGFQTRVFRNLYEEIDGKKTMRFKNPWTDKSLRDYEAKFLKQVLFTLAQVRKKMFPRLKFDFKNAFDSGLEKFCNNPANSWFLEVPLTKANLASRRATGYTFKESWRRLRQAFTPDGAIQNFQEFFEGLSTEEELERVNADIRRMSATNHFAWYETLNSHNGSAARASILNQKDPDFFETNVETLLMNFIVAQHEMEEMNDVLLQSKAILLTISSIGDIGNPKLKHIIKYIQDYLTVNVFNKSIMEEDTKKVMGIISPAKHLATTVYILGNLSSAVRDVTEGLLQNITRSVIKFQTNITSADLAKAYAIVMKDGTFSNVRSMNILNQLNIKYRISNVDIARIQEVLSTGRAGLNNAENWAYATLRRPDFLNRMTLFVARLIHDGVWDALSIDENGDLQYNWERDERFKYYAEHRKKPPLNDKKFLKQKGAYLSCILAYNREHSDNPLNIQDPDVALPSPYTSEQVEGIKSVSNSIYGSYDKSTKAMYEHIAIGQALGQFTTWMNGMIGNYWRKPGSPTGELKEIHSQNEFGEYEFFDEYYNIVVEKVRENGEKYYYNETTGEEVTGQVLPVIKYVPITSQGIIYSVLNLANKIVPVGFNQGGFKGIIDEIKKEIILNPQEAKNFRKLFSDIAIWLFIAMLYKFVLDPAYKDLKKNRNQQDILANSIEDILYRGTASSYDGFRGPWNVIDSFGNNMNPPAYKVTTKMLTDITKTVFGDKTLGQLVTQNVPVFRSFRQAYDQYSKQ